MDGLEALDAAREEAPDLILMDMSLPPLNRRRTAIFLKNTGATRHIPVIALTGEASTSERDDAIAIGCEDSASKPIDFAPLLKKVGKQLNR